jgi:hypothetical protein
MNDFDIDNHKYTTAHSYTTGISNNIAFDCNRTVYSFTLKDIVLTYFQQNRRRRAKQVRLHMLTIEISAKLVAVCWTTKTTQLHRHLEAVIKVDMRCLNGRKISYGGRYGSNIVFFYADCRVTVTTLFVCRM